MSYSSFGVADGGSVASWVPVALVSRAGGGNCDGGIGAAFAIGTSGCAGALPASVERSSGAPGARPPGAPTGGSLSAFWSGAAAASLPSTRGAPGALGCCAGLNTSERLPGVAAGGALTGACGDIAGGWSALGAELLEAILGIVLHALELHLELLVAVLQLLERAGELAQRTFHAVEADGQIAGVGLRHSRLLRLTLVALTLVALALLRRLLAAAEQIIEEAAGRTLLLRRRGAGQQQQGKRSERSDANSVS